MADIKKRKTLGLALGSGGFRGPVHIGVIKALIDNNIPIDYIAGSSIGAFVAAHYALYKNLDNLLETIIQKQKDKISFFMDISYKGGLLSGKFIEKIFRQNFNSQRFEDTKIPVKIIATDILTGEPMIFCKGDLALAVRASVSVPLTFKPVAFRDKLLVDGGISMPIPDHVVKDMGADVVISINLYNKYRYELPKPPLAGIVYRSLEILLYNAAHSHLQNTDIFIEPDTSKLHKIPRLKKYFSEIFVKDMMKIGEEATLKKIPEIKKLLGID